MTLGSTITGSCTKSSPNPLAQSVEQETLSIRAVGLSAMLSKKGAMLPSHSKISGASS